MAMDAGKIRVEDAVEMAKIVAELVRQGVIFEVRFWDAAWEITLTGGC